MKLIIGQKITFVVREAGDKHFFSRSRGGGGSGPPPPHTSPWGLGARLGPLPRVTKLEKKTSGEQQ